MALPAAGQGGAQVQGQALNPAAQRLMNVAHTAYDTYSHDCSHSIWFVLKQIVDPNQSYMVADDLMKVVKRREADGGRWICRRLPTW